MEGSLDLEAARVAETWRRTPRTARGPQVRWLLIPGLAVLFAVGWYVAIRTVDAHRAVAKQSSPIELARQIFAHSQQLERKRLRDLAALAAYDARLGTMLKVQPDPSLIAELIESMANRLRGTELSVLALDGALVASSDPSNWGAIEGLDPGHVGLDREGTSPELGSGPRPVARAELWMAAGEERQVFRVATSGIQLGEPLGMVAVFAPIADALAETAALAGVAAAVVVEGQLVWATHTEMRERFESFGDLQIGARVRIPAGDVEWLVEVDELVPPARSPQIRIVWAAEQVNGTPAGIAFGWLLWIPIVGAVLFGLLQAIAWDRGRAA